MAHVWDVSLQGGSPVLPALAGGARNGSGGGLGGPSWALAACWATPAFQSRYEGAERRALGG